MLDLQSKAHSPPPTGEAVERNKVFVSYSHKDRAFLERFQVHFKPLERDGLLDAWDDTRIQAGERWRDEIERALASARVAVLLVSADFLASDFIARVELPQFMRASQDEGSKIIPVILKPCRFQRVISLSCFQAINPWLKPVDQMEEWEQEALWTKLVITIEDLMGRPHSVGEDGRPTPSPIVISRLKRLQVILSQWVTAYVALPYSWLFSLAVVVLLVGVAYQGGLAKAREPEVRRLQAPADLGGRPVQGDQFQPSITYPPGLPGDEKELRDELLKKLVNLFPKKDFPAVAVITSNQFRESYEKFNASVRFKLPSSDKFGTQCAPFLVHNGLGSLEIRLLDPKITGPPENRSLNFAVPASGKDDFILVLIWMSEQTYQCNHDDPEKLKIVADQ